MALNSTTITTSKSLLAAFSSPEINQTAGAENEYHCRQDSGEAVELLFKLGYLDKNGRENEIIATSQCVATTKNRLALLELAARLERVFVIPDIHSSGAQFLGAEVSPAKFGMEPEQGRQLAGVGGKGLDFRTAFESCIGEASEYIALMNWVGQDYFARSVDSVSQLLSRDYSSNPKYSRRMEHEAVIRWMLDGIGYDSKEPNTTIDWITLHQLGGEETLPVPLDLCLRRSGTQSQQSSHRPRKAESSGCSAGATLEAAQYNGLMEVIERDAVALWWYGGRSADRTFAEPDLLLGGNFTDDVMRREAVRPYWLLDVTNDLGIPVIAAFSSDAKGETIVGGFSADMDPLAAARGAYLEMCQMELALTLVEHKIRQRGLKALNSMDRLHLRRSQELKLAKLPWLRPPLTDARRLKGRPLSTDEALSLSLEILNDHGWAVYWLNQSRDGISIPTVRVLVPGLQSGQADWTSSRLRNKQRSINQFNLRPFDLPPIY